MTEIELIRIPLTITNYLVKGVVRLLAHPPDSELRGSSQVAFPQYREVISYSWTGSFN